MVIFSSIIFRLVTHFLAGAAADAPTPNAPGYDADFWGESGIHVGFNAQHSRQCTQQSSTRSQHEHVQRFLRSGPGRKKSDFDVRKIEK